MNFNNFFDIEIKHASKKLCIPCKYNEKKQHSRICRTYHKYHNKCIQYKSNPKNQDFMFCSKICGKEYV